MWAENTPSFIVGDKNEIGPFIHFLSGLFVINSSYGIIVWTSWKIYKTMKTMRKTMSASTFEAQKQLTKILLIQVSINI